MKIPGFALRYLQRRLLPIADAREPDEIIGNRTRSRLRDGHVPVPNSFLHRWFLWDKNKLTNGYLHNFTRDDDDRALHDHPWWNFSILLKGSYIEHTISAGGIHRREVLTEGDIKFRWAWSAHRVECLKEYDSLQPGTSLKPIPCWSLFITGWTSRKWGFHCPTGWKFHRDFSKDNGCGDA